MSYQAVQWALDRAPMLRMPTSGKPDTTARAVLVARAERADEHGRDSHAGIEDVIWRTGFDERTIQRAEARLEAAGLLVADGTTRWGTPRWNLDMSLCRDEAERAEIEALVLKRKADNADRERARRRNQRAHSASTRVDATPPEPPVNRPGTTREPSREPPPGGTLPPDPLRPPSLRSGDLIETSLFEPLTPAQDQEGESLPREDEPTLRLVAATATPEPGPPRGIFPVAVPSRRRTRAEEAIAEAAARRAAAVKAHQARQGSA